MGLGVSVVITWTGSLISTWRTGLCSSCGGTSMSGAVLEAFDLTKTFNQGGPFEFSDDRPQPAESDAVKRDPKLKLSFEVLDVDCSIKYRLHGRSVEPEPIDY